MTLYHKMDRFGICADGSWWSGILKPNPIYLSSNNTLDQYVTALRESRIVANVN